MLLICLVVAYRLMVNSDDYTSNTINTRSVLAMNII
jgi:hypothetical protein